MTKRIFLKNSILYKRAIIAIAVLLVSHSSFGQKPIDLKDCQTINRIMNDTAIKNFLHTYIYSSHGVVFENTSHNIGCKSFNIGGRNYKIFDSATIVASGYVPNQIIQISAFEAKNEPILFVFEWMETGAQFNISRSSKGYKVRLVSIDHLD